MLGGMEAFASKETLKAIPICLTTSSIEGGSVFVPVRDKASWSIISKASAEYSPLSLGSTNPSLSGPLAWKKIYERPEHET